MDKQSVIDEIQTEEKIYSMTLWIFGVIKAECEAKQEEFWEEPFFSDLGRVFLESIIAFMYYVMLSEGQKCASLDVFNSYKLSDFDLIFKRFEDENPNHFAVILYKTFRRAAGTDKMAEYVIMSMLYSKANAIKEIVIDRDMIDSRDTVKEIVEQNKSCDITTASLNQEKSIYLQITEIIENDILKGYLLENGRVPSISKLAKRYTVSQATVSKGIDILVKKGILYKRRGIGIFILAGAKEIIKKERKAKIRNCIVELIKEAKELEINNMEIISMLESINEV